MSKSVYVSKAAAVATVAVAALALVTVIGMVIFLHTRIHQCPSPSPPTASTTASGMLEPTPDVRLPETLIPESYEIYLQVHLHTAVDNLDNQDLWFTGNSTVKLKCVKATNTIYIHSKALNLTVLGVTDEHGKDVPVYRFRVLEDETEFAEIELADTLRVGGIYYLSNEFQGECNGSDGLFYRTYKENNDKFATAFVVASHLESTEARKVFPCFDEPAMKAVFNITIIHRRGSVALSNMPQKDNIEMEIDGEEWVVTEFFPTVKMSTYLLAFIVSSFESKETNHGRIKLRTWSRPEAMAAGYVDYAHSITGKILDILEEYCGVKYPLSKLDQIGIPSFAPAGMENWGLIIYSEKTLMYDAETSSTMDKEWTARIIAHELAHQWFGNLVTMKWWNDLWLKEGFATYMSYLAIDRMEPNGNMKDLFVWEIQKTMSVEYEDWFYGVNEYKASTTEEISTLFNMFIYSKGGAILRMLAETLTESVFEKGVQSYVKAYQYSNVETKNFWSHLQRAVDNSSFHIPVAEVMDTWTQQPGYPLITINTTSGEVSQEHFFRPELPLGYSRTWQVPIKVMKSGSEEIKFDLITVKGPMSKSVYQCDGNEWILANVNYTGYYRVNYDPENWEKLLQQLETDHRKIPTLSRAQLIDDAFNLASLNYVNITLALRITKYLLNETELIPWKNAMINLHHLILMFDRSEVYSPMKAYLRELVGPLYDHFESFTIKSSIPNGYTVQLNQVNAVTFACANILPKCQKMATDLFDLWRKDPTTNPIHPNLRPMVYCSAIGAGGEVEWDFAWKMFKTSSSDVEKERLLEALACTKHVWILNRYLEYTLDPDKIKPELFSSTICFIAKNVVGQCLAWDFVRSQWSNITQMFSDTDSLEEIISGVTLRFSTKYDLQQLKKFEELHSGKDVFVESLRRTLVNIKWVKDHKQTVLEWFQREVSHENKKSLTPSSPQK